MLLHGAGDLALQPRRLQLEGGDDRRWRHCRCLARPHVLRTRAAVPTNLTFSTPLWQYNLRTPIADNLPAYPYAWF